MDEPNSHIRIAFFLPSLEGGGAERVFVTLANNFAARGYKIDLVVGNSRGPYRNEVSEKVNIVDLKKSRVSVCLIPLARYLRGAKPYALYSTMMHANNIAILANKISFTSTKIVIREAAPTAQTNGRPLEDGKTLYFRMACYLYEYADWIVGVSAGVLTSIQRDLKLKNDKVAVILNPVITEEFYKLARQPLPESLQIRDGATLVVAVGRLQKLKDYPLMLRSFAKFRKNCDSQLIILGEGSERAALEDLIDSLGLANDVLMPGFDSNPFRYLHRADLFVQSSVSEGMPNTIIQAMALGTPSVVTRTKEGPEEVYQDASGVIMVNDRSVDDFTAAMLSQLSAPATEPCEQWRDRFSDDKIADEYLELVSK